MTLTVEGLACRRNGSRVFGGLSFTVAPGEVRLVRGPNGAGKSSLLRVIAGLMPAEAGRIAFDGVSPADADGWADRVAFAGHLDAVKPQLTVADNLRFWSDLFGGGDVAAVVAEAGLEAFAGRAVHACSAGQRRRAGLARLLLADRPLWLLDEPTVALDDAAVGRLTAAIAAHAAHGGMALVATHVDLALNCAAPVILTPPAAGGWDAADDPFLEPFA
jgi:heme exporter protein A